MLAVVGFLALFIGILISVMLHEGGHFLTARHYGMKATQFFVGFGPTLWSRHKGETEYGVKALPVGGFVKIVGMTPLEELEPGDEDRAFFKQPARKRAVVLAAGSFVHFCLAILLVYGVVLFNGTPDDDAPVIGDVSTCVPVTLDATCDDAGAQPAPAARVIKAGDRVLAVNGVTTSTWREVVVAVRAAPRRPVTLTIHRDGETSRVTLTPVAVEREPIDGGTGTQTVGAIGVAQGLAMKHYGPIASVPQSADVMGTMLKGTYETLAHKLGTVTKLFSDDRDKGGLVGVVGAGRVSGEILSAQGEPLSLRIANIVFMLAGLNLFVGIFNLLPLLPLDGGHIAILGYEQARDRLRRMRGYRGPLQRVDLAKLMPITYAVVILFAGLTLMLLGADIVNPIRLTQ
jgi:membrane-associated protease RseP (regulator of RpoE activity)